MAGSNCKLGLDIGGVLSTMTDRRNTEIWEYVDQEAYVFLCAFIDRFGLDNLFIVTRTNQGVIGQKKSDENPDFNETHGNQPNI